MHSNTISAGRHPADSAVRSGIAAPAIRIAAHWGCASHSRPSDEVGRHGVERDVHFCMLRSQTSTQASTSQSLQFAPTPASFIPSSGVSEFYNQTAALAESMDLQRCGLKAILP